MTVWASVAANCWAAAAALSISSAASANMASSRPLVNAASNGHQRRFDTSDITATP